MGMNGKHCRKESDAVEMVNPHDKNRYSSSVMIRKQARATCSLTIIVLFIISMILVVVGISLIIVSSSKKYDCHDEIDDGNAELCGFSREAKRAGLDRFLTDVQQSYFKLHPHQAYHDPKMDFVEDREVLAQVYKPYNPNPSNLKKITDASLALLKRLNALKFNDNRLKPRERKTIVQAKHFLKHVFGQTYDMNYYTGDWLMGPNHFCWQPICDIGRDIFYHLDYFKPYNLTDLAKLR